MIRLPSAFAEVPVRRSLVGQVFADGRLEGMLEASYGHVGQTMSVQFPDRKSMEAEVRGLLRDDLVIDFEAISTDEQMRTLSATVRLQDFARGIGSSLYCRPYPFGVVRDSVASDLPGGYYVMSTRPVMSAVNLRFPESTVTPEDTTAALESRAGATSFSMHAEADQLVASWTRRYNDWHYPPHSKPQLDSLLHEMNKQQTIVVKIPKS